MMMSPKKRRFQQISEEKSQRSITHYFSSTKSNCKISTKIENIIKQDQLVEPILLSSDEDDFVTKRSSSEKITTKIKGSSSQLNKSTAKKKVKSSKKACSALDVSNKAAKENADIKQEVIICTPEISENLVLHNKENDKSNSRDQQRRSVLSQDKPQQSRNENQSQNITVISNICLNRPNILSTTTEKVKPIILQENAFNVDEDINTLSPTASQMLRNKAQNSLLENFTQISQNKRNISTDVCRDLNLNGNDNSLLNASFSTDTTEIYDLQNYTNLSRDSNFLDSTIDTELIKKEIEHYLASQEDSNIDGDVTLNTDYLHAQMAQLRKIIDNVVNNDDLFQLLRCTEQEMISKFLQMKTEYQYFCYKLFLRLPKWYNIRKLLETIKMNISEFELGNLYEYLQINGFIHTDFSNDSLASLLHQLDRPALITICRSFKIKRKSGRNKKGQLISTILTYCNTQSTLTAEASSDQLLLRGISKAMGQCAKLTHDFYTTFSRVHRLVSFVCADLTNISELYFYLSQINSGEIILPDYNVEENCIKEIFPQRQDFLEYSKSAEYKNQFIYNLERKDWECVRDICHKVYEEFSELLSKEQSQTLANPTTNFLYRFKAEHKYASILSEGSKHLSAKYTKEVKLWLELLITQNNYCQKRRGLWYDRLALIQMRYSKDIEEAAKIVIDGLSNSLISESGREELTVRALAIANRKKNKINEDLCKELLEKILENSDNVPFSIRVVQAQCVPGNTSGHKRYYIENTGSEQNYSSVEEVAMRDYKLNENYSHGYHCEGAVLSTLFFAAFWDLIYEHKVPNTFVSKLQYLPLDFYSRDFYTNRKAVIDARLEEIRTGWSDAFWEDFLTGNFEAHSLEKSLLSTRFIKSSEELVEVAKCVGREGLAAVFGRFVKDFGDMHAGLPDLFLWNGTTWKCKFVEHDRLSVKQILWLKFLRSAKLNIEVCHVHTSGSKLPRKLKGKVEKI